MKLSVIIVSYNVKHYLEQCLHSVWAAISAAGIEAEVFVVDNASTDHSVAHLRRCFPASAYPALKFIANSRNVGFGCANNQAALQARGQYVLFLNPDTLLAEQTLTHCLQYADNIANLGGLGVRMLKANGEFALESRRGLPTPWTAFCKMSGLAAAFPRSKTFGKYYLRYLDADRPSPIEIVSGAFMLCNRAALERCGLFDEAFFMYGEDIDLSFRLLRAGYANHYHPTPILHYKGESTQKSSYRYVHVFYEAMLIFFKKHYRHYRLALSLPVKAAIYLRALLALCGQQFNRLQSYLALGRPHEEEAYLFLGLPQHHAAIRQIADRWRLNIHCVEASADTLPQGHHQLSPEATAGRRIAIYDLAAYPRQHVLQLLARAPHRHLLGTWSPETQTLITPHAVYDLREE